MKTPITTVYLLTACSLLVSCADSGNQPTEDGAVLLAVNNTTSAIPPQRPNGADTGRLPAVLTPSPQGIPDNARERRERAQGPRRNGRFEPRPEINGQELRTYDGTGNHADNVLWGATFSHLQRIAGADYADGISSLAGIQRPSARAVSNALVAQADGESIPNAFNISDFGWQWGQFIDHDLDLTDGSGAESANIAVPVGDPLFDPRGEGDVEIPLSRAVFDPDTGSGVNNPRQQENEITSWLDASMIYGASVERRNALRVGDTSPLLRTSRGNLLPYNEDNLANANGFVADPTRLFLAGDIRVNEQLGLATMHTLFVREHNRLAREIAAQNSNLRADEVFEHTRRLVIATVQKITFEEYLPSLLGEGAIAAYQGYDSSINPTIFNEFSAAAFRLGHSMVNDSLLRLDAAGNEIPEGSVSLREAFFTAPQYLADEQSIEPVLRGLAAQSHQAIDLEINHTLRNFLFGAPGSGGFDLAALNIQRGRDHGLASYNDTRAALGLERVTSVAGITADTALQQALTDTYGGVDDIDLWVGGLAEDSVSRSGAQLGPLFDAIVRLQFTALRDGDRFWYQRSLNREEQRLIEDRTLAAVIRDNTAIGNELSDQVFRTGRR